MSTSELLPGRVDDSPENGLTLVFPSGMAEALRFARQTAASGGALLGASSLSYDPSAGAYSDWIQLPYVHEDGFGLALAEVISARGVSRIWTCHPAVGRVLRDLLPGLAPGVDLIEAQADQEVIADYRKRLEDARMAEGQDWFRLEFGRPRISAIHRAGLVRLVENVPGMTDLDKIEALIEVMRHAPKGDIVEIGSWWGRSAALLLLLGRLYGVGPVLCIDPWAAENWVQGVPVLDGAIPTVDPDSMVRIFEANLAPLAMGDLNYIRAPSGKAFSLYTPGFQTQTETFGATRYEGSIALLHIDGNHAYEAVDLDARLWIPKVRAGGWILFDDYLWPFGDGPRRVGDAFLDTDAARIEMSFVMGKTLFVKLKDDQDEAVA